MVRICGNTYIHACMYVHTYVRMYTYQCVTHIYTHTCTCICVYVCMFFNASRIRIMYTCIISIIRMHIHMYIHVCTCTVNIYYIYCTYICRHECVSCECLGGLVLSVLCSTSLVMRLTGRLTVGEVRLMRISLSGGLWSRRCMSCERRR